MWGVVPLYIDIIQTACFLKENNSLLHSRLETKQNSEITSDCTITSILVEFFLHSANLFRAVLFKKYSKMLILAFAASSHLYFFLVWEYCFYRVVVFSTRVLFKKMVLTFSDRPSTYYARLTEILWDFLTFWSNLASHSYILTMWSDSQKCC